MDMAGLKALGWARPCCPSALERFERAAREQDLEPARRVRLAAGETGGDPAVS